MKKKIWGIIIIIIAILIIAAIIYFFYKSATSPTTAEPAGSSAAPGLKGAGEPAKPRSVNPAVSLTKAEVKPDDLARMAAAFAERFGSYSNQSNYGNISDLQIFMTDALKSWSLNYIQKEKARPDDTLIYFGVVTKAILSEVKSFDAGEGKAEILVKTQRRESAGATSNSTIYYQDILIKYVRENGVWRVEGVYWQEK